MYANTSIHLRECLSVIMSFTVVFTILYEYQCLFICLMANKLMLCYVMLNKNHI